MRYRVGVDLGTASIGLAAVSLNEEKQPDDLLWGKVRIFKEPLDNGTGGLKSKKATRRAARMQRRQFDRRRGRMRHIVALASLLGIDLAPAPDGGASVLELRARAARHPIALDDLMRVFLRLAKRRGYAGEFRPKKEGAKQGEVEGGSNDLKAAMSELATARGVESVTVGEFLQFRWQQGQPTRLKVKEKRSDDSNPLPNLYALRSQLEAEFAQIWRVQAEHHTVLNGEHDCQPLQEVFHAAIFHQRPLKSVSGMVGQCPLEPTLPRAPRAQPAFQHFRIEKTLVDLRWGAGRRAMTLTAKQKDVIRELLDKQKTVSFKSINETLKEKGHPGPDGRGLNMDRLSREELHGNTSNHAFNKLGLGPDWQALDERTQVQIINFLADLGSPEQLDAPLWYTCFVKQVKTGEKDVYGNPIYAQEPRAFSEKFIGFINRLKEQDEFGRLSGMGFDGGRASYSVKALRKLTEWLADPWWPGDWQGEKRIDEESAIRVCYPAARSQPKESLPRLPAPKPTGNAVVDVALRQLQQEFNAMIAALGATPEQIVVELTREMGVGVVKRNERESAMTKNQKARKDAEKAIREHGATVTPSRIRRYLLWREQGEKFCPYCDRTINLADALNGKETEYEHILPKSLTQVGLKRSEIVLAHRDCNQKKGNRTPWQAWGYDPNRWNLIEQRAAWFEKNKQDRKARLLRLKDFEKEVLTDQSIDDFADRQFHQASWIAKEAAQWLQGVCATPVSVSRGELTAAARRAWRLDTVIPQVRIEEGLPVLDEEGKVVTPEEFSRYKPVWEGHRLPKAEMDMNRKPDKRIDHRHHLIDAITLALTSRGLFQQMARTYKLESDQCAEGERPRLKIPEPPLHNVRELALKLIRACPLSIKPDRYPDGEIFEDTAYGIALKEGEDKPRLTRREQLSTLVDRKKGTVEQARKAIAAIVSDSIRAIVSEAFEKRIAEGKSAPAALAEPVFQELYGRKIPIRKVCCYRDKYAGEAVLIRHTSRNGKIHKKYLLNGGYAWLESELRDEKVVRQELVPIQRALRQKNQSCPDGVMRLHKGDTVQDSQDGKKYRVGYFTSEGKVFLVPITDPRAFDAIKESGSGKKRISFGQVGRLKVLG